MTPHSPASSIDRRRTDGGLSYRERYQQIERTGWVATAANLPILQRCEPIRRSQQIRPSDRTTGSIRPWAVIMTTYPTGVTPERSTASSLRCAAAAVSLRWDRSISASFSNSAIVKSPWVGVSPWTGMSPGKVVQRHPASQATRPALAAPASWLWSHRRTSPDRNDPGSATASLHHHSTIPMISRFGSVRPSRRRT